MNSRSKNKIMIESVQYITGNQNVVKVQGPKKIMEVYKQCLNESRKLYKLLNETKNVTLKEIEEQVKRKNLVAAKFKNLTGETWPF